MIKLPKDKEIIKKIMKDLNENYKEFMSKTEEPREIKRDTIGQFVGVGKLKKPENHFGKTVNVVTIWTVQLKDDFSIKITKTVLTFDELKEYRDCCNKVIDNWND